ncbi:junction plakoglobin-like isoform X2 [Protopterus annectens]|uniref:junction plakoglobin-like isoform X2 n=1 Tax=Protopterus annectens TaxID=7888 RepID=UPI001CF96477|nr:junction plakoglobin-like isoform X2 [Protopterus annectens]
MESYEMLKSAILNLLSNTNDRMLLNKVIPELTKLLYDDDPVVASKAAIIVNQLSKSDAACYALMQSPQIVQAIIHVMHNNSDLETARCISSIFHSFSHHQQGLQVIFQSGGIPALVRMLSSPVESALFWSITTLHNLLLYQEGAKIALRLAEGIERIVPLLNKNNPKFLAIAADCLYLLSYGNPESKLIILAFGGPEALVRILRDYNYEKLLWSASNALHVLSVCPNNKPTIVKAGGMQVLTKHLVSSSPRLVMNSLWTLRNLSDAASKEDGLDNLLKIMVHELSNENPDVVACCSGILSNLTCQNNRNKTVVTQSNGAEILIHVIVRAEQNEDILEAAVSSLRNLTVQHQDAKLAQDVVRESFGIPTVVNLLKQQYHWHVIKATAGLVRNLALNPENHIHLREVGANYRLVELIKNIHLDSSHSATSRSQQSYSDGNDACEVLEKSMGALCALAQDPVNRQEIAMLGAIPRLVQLLYSLFENIQRAATALLHELAQDKDAANAISAEGASAPLMKLLHSQNERIGHSRIPPKQQPVAEIHKSCTFKETTAHRGK